MASFHSGALEQLFFPFLDTFAQCFLPVFCLITLPLAAVPLLPANVNPQQKSLSQAAIAQAALQEGGI